MKTVKYEREPNAKSPRELTEESGGQTVGTTTSPDQLQLKFKIHLGDQNKGL